jgi:hypothetical protein
LIQYIVGIDPGVSGAIVTLNRYGTVCVSRQPMPTLKNGLGREVLDLQAISKIFAEIKACNAFVAIEQLQPMPMDKGGTLANYARGRSLGVLEALCVAHGLPYQLIRPQTWQKQMLAGVEGTDTKARSIIAAQRLFPDVNLKRTERSKKLDDGIADALLIAEYARRKNA